ncbi:ABC-type multidrug transport system permease subunit [Natranaerovirga pectinivora]|uniref:ABC-type multidrug transport system permease subunit n=1 Tax=Natranaerovirga pectinivora TaxID=682400 RepID=A0A4R3MHK4_9FIRM|nr:ABC transporter permease [Natranaerovirga pectinivora]TCT13102.1 ABC-type multidrug transport system permease subunit [Natranaerovirga pectinivora]
MFSIIWLRIKRIKESLPIIIGLTVMAFGLIAAFSSAFKSEYRPVVFLVDRNETEYAKLFINNLEAADLYDFRVTTYDNAMDGVQNFGGIAAVIIEEDFLIKGDNSISIVNINTSAEYGNLLQVVNNKLNQFVNQINLSNSIQEYFQVQNMRVNALEIDEFVSRNYNDGWNSPTYKTNSYFIEGSSSNDFMLKHSLIGFTIFFSMYTMIFGIGDMVEEKRIYVYHRQLVTPIKSRSILFGNLIYTFSLSFIQVLIMILGGAYIFGIDWGNNIGAILLVMSAFVFCGTSLGLFMSSMVKNIQQLSALTPIVLTSTAMIGGCMWPLEMIDNNILLFLASLTPQKWAVTTISRMAIYNYAPNIIIMPIIILLVMGGVLLVLGTNRFNKFS